MMNKPHVQQWISALRSGTFKQGRGKLRAGNRYCCLGVVCFKAGMKAKRIPATNTFKYGVSSSILPKTAQRWLGVKDADPLVGDMSCTFLNDTQRLTFKQIAARIEKHWLKK